MRRVIVAALLMSALGSAATAGGIGQLFGIGVDRTPTTQAAGGPPAGYSEQHWISPNGCSYSRAKAPGYAPTWHLILNGTHVGLTNAHTGCVAMYTQTNY